ncbi:hypothetical protein [Deinococcus yavapaiensis]|uniref:Uncharacterized protein n=1 Tax=Deinococcus yavapaiensis KR-236 TaxID=694435 RepID=A0A318S8H9_9DEIO|nr:hypothetical protein [Deinococcus yavapaiensis]PYE54835.1 hypothetical protein DES52_104106 [Deinococcus yavapaiensis KR-236]
MIELRGAVANVFVLGVSDEIALREAGRVDVLVETASGERYAGTLRTLDDIDASLTGIYLPVTDTLVLRDLTPDTVLPAIEDLINGGVLDEVFLEVLEEVES